MANPAVQKKPVQKSTGSPKFFLTQPALLFAGISVI